MPEHIGDTTGEFSVVVFFMDGTNTYIRAWIGPEEAAQVFHQLIDERRPVHKFNLMQRVIITDGGDCTAMEWTQGEGITFPTKEQLEAADVELWEDD